MNLPSLIDTQEKHKANCESYEILEKQQKKSFNGRSSAVNVRKF
jgi:hypothetical protein